MYYIRLMVFWGKIGVPRGWYVTGWGSGIWWGEQVGVLKPGGDPTCGRGEQGYDGLVIA